MTYDSGKVYQYTASDVAWAKEVVESQQKGAWRDLADVDLAITLLEQIENRRGKIKCGHYNNDNGICCFLLEKNSGEKAVCDMTAKNQQECAGWIYDN
jgi:hypothetical protein